MTLIQHGALADNYEDQMNKKGYTYGKDAEWVQEVGDCITQCWVQGLVTDREYDRILDRFHKKILMNKKYLKKCADTGKAESEGSLSWLGKRCEDCGNKKCKELGILPKGYDCALWQPKVENYSIKTVTNAKEAENYPISEDISKGIEEINKLIFENGQAESEDKE